MTDQYVENMRQYAENMKAYTANMGKFAETMKQYDKAMRQTRAIIITSIVVSLIAICLAVYKIAS